MQLYWGYGRGIALRKYPSLSLIKRGQFGVFQSWVRMTEDPLVLNLTFELYLFVIISVIILNIPVFIIFLVAFIKSNSLSSSNLWNRFL